MALGPFKNKAALIAFLFINSFAWASGIIDTIATKAGGYDIPIKIMLPEKSGEKFPVHFYVHGGGWNGGTATEVPEAGLPNDAKYLSDRLGIIYVGLAYRCKGNKGTFQLAIEDLEASIAWFMANAKTFKADLTRIGFGGSSAGTTLSAILAQRYVNCKLYIGNEGMYNIIDQDENLSYFPSREGKAIYGLTTPEQKLAASPFYNLRENPAAALLFHGKDDFLCHFSQSEKYAKQIVNAGGKAKVVLYENINHTCLNPGYPEVFKNSVIEIAHLFAQEFQLEQVDFRVIEKDLENTLKGMYPKENVTEEQWIGSWKNKKQTLVLKANGKGTIFNNKGILLKDITYKNKGFYLSVYEKNTNIQRNFYLRKNNKTIYELIQDESRINNRRIDYHKQNL
jgi:acetyl esterase/lipase